ncbi:hypothetical protein AGLY_011847 [Aphis glycines]|uniref:Uncharacterized protein n=1 Tax=Aphis glycines TaxID=307491 RepID=A0A6G0TBZ5_APHGL|nr:hypothetical protein AGLY_011847 [Aphis glycines]
MSIEISRLGFECFDCFAISMVIKEHNLKRSEINDINPLVMIIDLSKGGYQIFLCGQAIFLKESIETIKRPVVKESMNMPMNYRCKIKMYNICLHINITQLLDYYWLFAYRKVFNQRLIKTKYFYIEYNTNTNFFGMIIKKKFLTKHKLYATDLTNFYYPSSCGLNELPGTSRHTKQRHLNSNLNYTIVYNMLLALHKNSVNPNSSPFIKPISQYKKNSRMK